MSLDLSFTTTPPETSFPSNLREIKFDGCHWLTDDHLEEISRSTTLLESVSLYWCVKVTDRGVKSLIVANPKITCLNLSGVNKVTDDSLFAVAGNCNLEIADLTRLPLITDEGVLSLGKCKLKKLSLYATTQLTSHFYENLEIYTFLEDLDLCGHQTISDSQIANAIVKMPKLERLNLTWCLSTGDLTLEALKTCGNIRWLSLFGIKTLSRTLITDLIKVIGKQLTAFDIRGIPSVQDLTLNNCHVLRETLPSLVEFKLHS